MFKPSPLPGMAFLLKESEGREKPDNSRIFGALKVLYRLCPESVNLRL